EAGRHPRRSPLHARRCGADGRRRAAALVADAGPRSLDLQAAQPRRRRRRTPDSHRERGAVPRRLVEVDSDCGRPAKAADLDARDRDARAAPARRRARLRVGSDRRGRGCARVECRLRVDVGGAVRADRARRVRVDQAGAGGAAVKVVVVSGIWPPDVGGPASHAPDVADFLHGRGHDVEVVTTARGVAPRARYRVFWTSRQLPKGVLHLRAADLIRRRASGADVVYTTGMFGRSFAGASLARTPYVVKLTADPAFERSRRRGEFSGGVEEFQHGGGGARAAAYRFARDVELRHAAHVITPSAWLRERAIRWGVKPEHVSVLQNPTPTLPELRPRDELRESFALN